MAVDGKWQVTVKTPMGDQDATVDIKSSGGSLSGTLANSSGTVPIEEGKVDGNAVSFKARVSSPFPMTLDISGTVDGNTISGNVNTSFGASPFSGKRV